MTRELMFKHALIINRLIGFLLLKYIRGNQEKGSCASMETEDVISMSSFATAIAKLPDRHLLLCLWLAKSYLRESGKGNLRKYGDLKRYIHVKLCHSNCKITQTYICFPCSLIPY